MGAKKISGPKAIEGFRPRINHGRWNPKEQQKFVQGLKLYSKITKSINSYKIKIELLKIFLI